MTDGHEPPVTDVSQPNKQIHKKCSATGGVPTFPEVVYTSLAHEGVMFLVSCCSVFISKDRFRFTASFMLFLCCSSAPYIILPYYQFFVPHSILFNSISNRRAYFYQSQSLQVAPISFKPFNTLGCQASTL